MRWILLAASALCLSLWIFFGSYAGPLGLPVPALGPFVNPATGFWHSATPDHVKLRGGELQIDHPAARGSVVFDERGVPHIFAPDLKSAIFLQGYVTARDRLWQMDISTRSTGGRLSEVLGKNLNERDTRQIQHGYRAAARHTVNTWREHYTEDYEQLEIYAAGINAYIAQLAPSDYPIEFKLLDYQPEPWTVYKSALTSKGMSQSMTDRWSDAEAAKALDSLGRATFDVLFPSIYPKQSPIVPSRTPFDFEPAPLRVKEMVNPAQNNSYGSLSQDLDFKVARPMSAAKNNTDAAKGPYPFDYHPANGSNNWVVASSKSETGKPILASDPHLGLSLPSIWYEVQIHTPDINCRGVSLPGLPLIVIGFNDHLAWGMTNGGIDVTDWYRMDWLDADKTKYRLDSQVVNVTYTTDTILTKGGQTEIITTPWTAFGPVTTLDTASAYYALAKQQVSMFTPKDRSRSAISAFSGAMRAKNYAEFKTAMSNYLDPIMNFAYGDRHGDITVLSNGYIPVRKKEQGRFIMDGSQRANDWQGYVPYSHLPESLNPQRGFASSANQKQTDETYPYPYHGINYPQWRARMINRKLSQLKSVNQREMKSLQLSAQSVLAEELLPLLLARINRNQLDQSGRALFQLLAEWDYNFRADSKAASYFEVWRRRVSQLTQDELGRDNDLPWLTDWNWISLLRNSPDHSIFDIQSTPSRETAAILIQRAFDEMLEADEEPGEWYQERKTHIRHLGLIPGFGTGTLVTNGHRSAPNAIGGTHGPSWRMVVELGERPRAWGVLPGGPSGNPASPLYESGVAEWAKGQYYELVRYQDLQEAKRKGSAILNFN